MKTAELLEQAGTVLDDRSDLISGDPDVLWPDTLLVRYFNQAQEKYAREAWCLQDDTTRSVCALPLYVGERSVPLHPSVLRVLGARFSDSVLDLYREKGQFPSATPGRATSYTQKSRALVLSNPPDTTTALLDLNIRVARLPLTQLSIDALEGEPEISEQYHLELVDWVVYRALSQPTVDSEGRSAAREYRDMFMANLRLAKRDRIREETSDGEWAFTVMQGE